jgi:hypothetical protein
MQRLLTCPALVTQVSDCLPSGPLNGSVMHVGRLHGLDTGVDEEVIRNEGGKTMDARVGLAATGSRGV